MRGCSEELLVAACRVLRHMCVVAQRFGGHRYTIVVWLVPGRTTETVECIADDLYADHLVQADNGMVDSY